MLPKAQLQQKLKIKKPKLLRSNPLRKSLLLEGNDYGFLIDDEDVYIGYRRPEVAKELKIQEPDDDLPEDIKWKLFLARQVALLKYREVWGTKHT